ncbi:MAG: hypothetical protein ABI539_06085 [Acidobacteriota bacterium]
MKQSVFSFFIVLFAFASVTAQSSLADWANIESLSPRKSVMVETRSGATLKGRINSVDTNSLVINSKGRSVSIQRGDVQRVYLTKRGSIVKRAALGAAAGAGIGTAIGVVGTVVTKDPLVAAGGFIFGIPAGAAIGAMTAGSKRGDLIYSSQ